MNKRQKRKQLELQGRNHDPFAKKNGSEKNENELNDDDLVVDDDLDATARGDYAHGEIEDELAKAKNGVSKENNKDLKDGSKKKKRKKPTNANEIGGESGKKNDNELLSVETLPSVSSGAGGQIGLLRQSTNDDLEAENEANDENITGKNGKVPPSPRFRSVTQIVQLDSRRKMIEERKCGQKCMDKIYSLPFISLFFDFIHVILSKFLLLCDIAFALYLSDEIWHKHEFFFAGSIVLIASPFLISWCSCLIQVEQVLIERKFGKGWKTCVMSPIMFLYLIAPFGCILLIIVEICVFISDVFESFFRLLICMPKKVLIHQSTNRESFSRFRSLTHMLSQSIPQLGLYFALYYFFLDDFTAFKIYIAAGASVANIIYTFFAIWRDARAHGISFGEDFILSLRLFGGFIPSLQKIKDGKINKVNWSQFVFGNYSYALFADAIESPFCQLNRMIISSLSLAQLSNSLCYQLGAACREKRVKVELWKGISPWAVWRLINGRHTKISLRLFKSKFRNIEMIQDKAEEAFVAVYADLTYMYENDDAMYYYSQFQSDWSDGIFAPLFSVNTPDIVATSDDPINNKLLNVLLGAGLVNEIDPVTKESALFQAIVTFNYDLINKLCEKGAKTTSHDWEKLGNLMIQSTEDGDYEKLSLLLNLAKRKHEIEIDLTYKNELGRTVLHVAAMNGRKDIVELFLDSQLGADVLDVDHDGKNAAQLAREAGHGQLEDFLRDQF